MHAIATLVPLLVKASLFVLVFALGLKTSPSDAGYLFRHPARLARVLLAMHVIVPLVAALVVATIPLRPAVRIALVLMAASPVPPILPGKQLKLGGHAEYVFGLLFAVSLLSIVIVPLTLTLFSAAFSVAVAISPGAVARLVAQSILLPLAAGMAVRRLAPALAARMASPVSRIGSALLLAGLLPVLIVEWRAMAALIGRGTLIALVAVVAVALVAGDRLGGPDPGDRATLAMASASRHPGVALLIVGANIPDQRPAVTAAVLLYLITASVLAIPYDAWRKRHYGIDVASGPAMAGPRA
jgi:bile acid:Na+ symporter, BASS family